MHTDVQSGPLTDEEVRAGLGMAELEPREMGQPLVFFRVGWDFRWLSRSSVVARLLGEAGETTGIESSAADDEPAELCEFLATLRQLVQGEQGPTPHAGLAAPDELQVSGFAQRDVFVVPGGWHRDDAWLALRCAVKTAAAVVLPPEEGAFAWAALWSRPTVVVAAADQLAAIDAELGETRARKGKRALARVRAVVAVGSTTRDSVPHLDRALPAGCQWISA